MDEKIKKAEKQLSTADTVLGQLIVTNGHISHAVRTDYFYSLCRSIVGQQVSVAAATTIFSRLQDVSGLEPARVAVLTDEQAKAIGLSRQKKGYITDLAAHFVQNPAVYDHLNSLSDEDVIKELCAVKGIGVWTTQMFIMFTLCRLDVFAPGDIGLQRAMARLYGDGNPINTAGLITIADGWRPYRTVACWHLWRSLNNEPIKKI
jgi:DNA-3-methyladenine glycosylase II